MAVLKPWPDAAPSAVAQAAQGKQDPAMGIHLGSCHCGAVRLRIDTDEPLGPYFRCDCSLHSRKGAVMGEAARSALEITSGAQQLATHALEHG